MTPTLDEQIRFLVKLQRLLDEGLFVASYKFALLLSLADLSIEKGDDSGSPLTVSTDEIAEKFIQCYWRQAVPYATGAKARVLKDGARYCAHLVGNFSNGLGLVRPSKIKLQVVIESENENQEAMEGVACLERGALRVAEFDLTLA